MNRFHGKTEAIAIALVLATAALAGCIGQTSDDASPTSTSGDAASTAAPGSNQTVLETREIPFEGSGTGKGLEPMEGSCFNCAWIVSEGAMHELEVPEDYQSGTVTFEWDSTASQGGMWLWLRDGGDETVHVFHVDDSPFEVSLDGNDERLEGVETVTILPADVPAAAHVQASWSGTFTFQVPTDAPAGSG